jgi:DNA-binding response OmpR family regulator
MSRRTATTEPPSSRSYATTSILLYSDRAELREQVRLDIGDTIGRRGVTIEWTEAATPNFVTDLVQTGRYDLIIADGETKKLGGIGLTRQMRQELDWRPTVLVLLQRAQDAWLASWSGADAGMELPVDPFELRTVVADLLGIDD